jgi:predicted ribosome-associated RNA-binding protein Tma20
MEAEEVFVDECAVAIAVCGATFMQVGLVT